MDRESTEVATGLDSSKETRGALITQFENPQSIEINGKKVKVVDILPDNQKDDVPAILAPGWVAGPEVFRENILSLAQLGRRIISINSYHGIKTSKAEDFPEVELRKMTTLIEVLDQKGIDKVDVIGHSEACPYLTIAATLFPNKFRNIVLVNPVGMIGKDNISGLSIRALSEVINEIANSFKIRHHIKPIAKSFVEAGKAIASNPLQSLKEGIAMSEAQIQHLLRGLKEKGIGISIIHAGKDRAFPMDRVQKTVKRDQFHGFYSVAGIHSQIYLEAKRYSLVADEALTALEKRKK